MITDQQVRKAFLARFFAVLIPHDCFKRNCKGVINTLVLFIVFSQYSRDGTSESDEDYFPPTTAFDSDDDYEPATSSPTKKGKKGKSKKATPSPTKSPATPKSKAVQSPGNLPFGQIGQSPKVEFFNSVSPSKNFPKPSGKKRSFNSAKAQKRKVNADLKKTKAVIRAAVEQSLQVCTLNLCVVLSL